MALLCSWAAPCIRPGLLWGVEAQRRRGWRCPAELVGGSDFALRRPAGDRSIELGVGGPALRYSTGRQEGPVAQPLEVWDCGGAQPGWW